MTDDTVTIARWICGASAVVNLLQATIFAGAFRRRVVAPMAAMGERSGQPMPALMQDARVLRGWPALMAVLFAAAWWYLGTPDGAARLHQYLR